jgi:hypothetical protein
MKKGQLIALVLVALVVGGAWVLVGDGSPPATTSAATLLDDVSPGSIERLEIEKGAEKVVLALKDDSWTVADREGYAADANKVRSLMLKLFDMSSSQTLPSRTEAYAKLGVADESLAEGFARIGLFGPTGQPLAHVLLGKVREGSASQSSAGQYVRRQGNDKVVLLGLPLPVDTQVSAWLDSQVANVREALVFGIEQYALGESGRTLSFALERTLLADGLWSPMMLRQPNDASRPLEESVLLQVRSGLENFRLQDIEKSTDVVFDRETVFKLTSGIVYSVKTGKIGDTYRAKVEVSRPDELQTRLSALIAESESVRKAQALEKKQTADNDANKEAEETSAEKADTQDQPLAVLATAQEADLLAKRFSTWTYVLAEFQAKKFRFELEELFTKQPAESTP